MPPDPIPAEFEIDIVRHDPDWPAHMDDLIINAVHRVQNFLELQFAGPAELSVLLTDDREQKQLNTEWRDKPSATNVLSFPQIEPFAPLTGLLGDISLARETLEKEATDLNKTFQDHLTHLVVHGFLHILGYDHLSDDEAQQMERLETDILATLGMADPYADE